MVAMGELVPEMPGQCGGGSGGWKAQGSSGSGWEATEETAAFTLLRSP